jgi:hypothetical protein
MAQPVLIWSAPFTTHQLDSWLLQQLAKGANEVLGHNATLKQCQNQLDKTLQALVPIRTFQNNRLFDTHSSTLALLHTLLYSRQLP